MKKNLLLLVGLIAASSPMWATLYIGFTNDARAQEEEPALECPPPPPCPPCPCLQFEEDPELPLPVLDTDGDGIPDVLDAKPKPQPDQDAIKKALELIEQAEEAAEQVKE